MSARNEAPDAGRYAAVIREARKAKGLNQQGLAELLGLSRNTVAGWETGHSRPDLDTIPSLCHALGVTLASFFGVREGVTRAEKQLITSFRMLGAGDQKVIQWQVDALVAGRKAEKPAEADAIGKSGTVNGGSGRKRVDAAKEMERLRSNVISLYRSELSAAAGFGTTLDAPRGESVWLKRDAMTGRADEIITVSGRSMEPTFMDGDEVLVQHVDSLREGEIGIFFVDGEGFIKEYRLDGLHSHNPAYRTMAFTEDSDVRCLGKVLGKVQDAQRLTKEEQTWMEEGK